MTIRELQLPRLILFCLAALNLLGFFLMGWDKRRARTGRRRVPERVLFAVALLGGSLGVLAGIHAFRHKTRRPSFSLGVPLILLLQAVLAGWLLWRIWFWQS